MNRRTFAIVALSALFLRTCAALPPISCDSNGIYSPVRVEWVGDYCFKTRYIGPMTGCSGTCCDTDVFRVDFGVRPECANNIEDISVISDDPMDVDDSFVLLNWDDRGMLTLANIWEGYTYCFTMSFPAGDTACDVSRFADACTQGPRGGCEYRVVNTLADCCPTFELYSLPLPPPNPRMPDIPNTPLPPSPPTPVILSVPSTPLVPSPPPPSQTEDYPGFPYCNCMNKESQYMIQYEGYNLADEECFAIWTKDPCPDPKSPCCIFDINKIELAIPNECLSSVAYARVNGTIRSISQAWGQGRTKDKAVFKVTNLDRNLEIMDALGQSIDVCLKMRDNARCRSVREMCGGTGRCTYSIFERDKNSGYCCVIGTAPVSRLNTM